jgi:hypothetical protein
MNLNAFSNNVIKMVVTVCVVKTNDYRCIEMSRYQLR